jgi:hypothetical protein
MTATIKDGFWMLTIRKGHAFIPTMAQTEAGFYMGIDPVEVVDASDRKAVVDAVLRAIARGNPRVPTPTRDNFPEDVLLKYANVKSLSTFEKLAQTWKFSKRQGAYLIAPYRPLKSGGSEEDPERTEAIPTEEPLETAVQRLVERATQDVGVSKR